MRILENLYFIDTDNDWVKTGRDITDTTNYVDGSYSGDAGSVFGSQEYTTSGSTVGVKMILISTRTISSDFFVFIVENYDHQGVVLKLNNSGTSTTVLTKTFSAQTDTTNTSRFFYIKNSSSLTFDEVELVFTPRASDNKIEIERTTSITSDVSKFQVDIDDGSGYLDSYNFRMRIMPVSAGTVLDHTEYSTSDFIMLDDDIANTSGFVYFTPAELSTITDAFALSTDTTTRWKILGKTADSFDFEIDNGGKVEWTADSTKDSVVFVHAKSTASGSFYFQRADASQDLSQILFDNVNDSQKYLESKYFTDDRYVFRYVRSTWLHIAISLGYMTETEYNTLRQNLRSVKEGDYKLITCYNNKFYFFDIDRDLSFNLKYKLYRINLALSEVENV